MGILKNYNVTCPFCKDRNTVELEIQLENGLNENSKGCQCHHCNNYFLIEYSIEIVINTNLA